ncbi:MAG: heat-inducible transcription repressor HrcA [Candidatus Omnitrophica bacterium]|nr:heat-inducible transcription repressor HrcA [Candidatus Omnitrophota bacterium]
MIVTHLKSRTHRILEAIVLTYAESGAPVGSEFLWERYRFGVSPATIRNVMGDLEEQGLITHPHTSAGRIPTDLGYRYYADLLMQPKRLNREEEQVVDALTRTKGDDPVEFLQNAAFLLSELTNEASAVLVPALVQGSFRHLELIPTDPREVVGVLIASEGMVKHAVLQFEEELDSDELIRIERFLNQELSGMPLSKVHSYLERCLLEANDPLFLLYKRAMELLSVGPFFQEEAQVLLEGASRVLEAPEFQDLQRARGLLREMDRREGLAEILRKDLAADEVKLHIGSENRGTSLVDCTVAAAPYRFRGGGMGAIGVLGPTRMDYPRVTALVARMAQAVSRVF